MNLFIAMKKRRPVSQSFIAIRLKASLLNYIITLTDFEFIEYPEKTGWGRYMIGSPVDMIGSRGI
jgi:hypothetical protein